MQTVTDKCYTGETQDDIQQNTKAVLHSPHINIKYILHKKPLTTYTLA